MVCRNCNSRTHLIRVRDGIETCPYCSDISSVYIPDVYFKEPYFEENFATDKSPQGQWITSKSDKGRKMKELRLNESGDRKHGARL